MFLVCVQHKNDFSSEEMFYQNNKTISYWVAGCFFSGTLTIEADSKSNEKITGALK